MRKPNQEYLVFENLNMEDVCHKIKEKFYELYGIRDIVINNQVCYNLIKRPNCARKLLRDFVNIQKSI